jgi:hypothetical protein
MEGSVLIIVHQAISKTTLMLSVNLVIRVNFFQKLLIELFKNKKFFHLLYIIIQKKKYFFI